MTSIARNAEKVAVVQEVLPDGYKHGRARPYFSTFRSPVLLAKTAINKVDHVALYFLVVVTVAIRFYNFPYPKQVVFDETHFGGFTREYMYGDFFVDVHPPLSKLAYYVVALFSSWDGVFEFARIGDKYTDEVPYVAMRLLPTLLGVFTVLLTYGTLRASGCRSLVALFGSSLVAIDNSMVTQSRLILLDSPLLFGISLTMYGFKKFQLTEPFTRKWYKFLICTGIGLGVSLSVKCAGAFTVATIGALTVLDLWYYLGDLEVSDFTWFKHVIARIFGFIIIPLTIYLGSFAAHFALLPNNGTGSGSMSPDFQATLSEGEKIVNMPAPVSYGSNILLKHYELGQYLHSHDANYQTGSQEQQVTVYGFSPDFNNEWTIELKNKNIREGDLQNKIRPIQDGDTIRLFHRGTKKYLRANDVRPPISEKEYNNEVSCAGEWDMDPDVNFEWKVRIVAQIDDNETSRVALTHLRTAQSVFQLIHQGTRCVLLSHREKLPKYAFEQFEVTCVNEPTIPNTLWYIESNSHPKMDNNPEVERVHLRKLTFWDKVKEYHQAMWRANKGLTSSHDYESLPETWPFLMRGVKYLDSNGEEIYYMGNLMINYVGFFIVSLILAKKAFYLLKISNPFKIPSESFDTIIFHGASFDFILGWILNYLPYFHMGRQLFLHHYLVALYFSILSTAQYLEYQYAKRRYLAILLMVSIFGGAVYCFVPLMPIIYGTPWTFDQCQAARFIGSWDFNCK
ncbi:dolichyl-phosphate-mannose--protein mannosyltransferase 5 [[Candida] anglica]|uniref:Dolichyl-phosphate-mannose--protein mannosyltransferase n=1 Tax=[Candida] anglica TaxID=148631 RepID=A0ABP0EGE1_9ASCO